MCGIIGYVGNKDAVFVLKNGLKNLEYRGYDSSGIAYIKNKKLEVIKRAGNVDNLFSQISKSVKIKSGIAHTRWATHGKATNENAHPHLSEHKKFALVHNGIIENYEEIKTEFLKDTKFSSQTDTEVIVQLIEKLYDDNLLTTLQKVVKILKGSFALAILNCFEPDKIYFARKDSPLIVGVGKNENFVASDLMGFLKYTRSYIILKNESIGFITKKEVKIFDFNLKKIEPEIKSIEDKHLTSGKGDYDHFMLKEINEIPETILNTYKLYLQKNNPLSVIPKNFWNNISQIVIVACGTSYHAGLVGKKLLEKELNKIVKTEIASEFIYDNPVIDKNTLCIFVSQSGETADTLTAVKISKQKGAKTLAITNVKTSSIVSLCDHSIFLNAGSEIAVASTKAYNGQIVCFFALSKFLANNFKIDKLFYKKLESVFKNLNIREIENITKLFVQKIKSAKYIFMVGRDYDYVTCLEASLKLKEISYIECSGYPAGELKHGTIALIDNNCLVFGIITQKSLIDKTLNIINQTKARGGKTIIVTQFTDEKIKSVADGIIYLKDIDEELMPLLSVIPFQMLAYLTSVSLGNNPDMPRNLAKSVTVE